MRPSVNKSVPRKSSLEKHVSQARGREQMSSRHQDNREGLPGGLLTKVWARSRETGGESFVPWVIIEEQLVHLCLQGQGHEGLPECGRDKSYRKILEEG